VRACVCACVRVNHSKSLVKHLGKVKSATEIKAIQRKMSGK
jgi:hypothetical protein